MLNYLQKNSTQTILFFSNREDQEYQMFNSMFSQVKGSQHKDCEQTELPVSWEVK